MVVAPLSKINGRKINEEKKVLKKSTGITALSFNATFFNVS
jgi:hypothetical protein